MKVRVTRFLVAIAALAMALIALPAYAAPTDLQPTVSYNNGQLHIQGVLTSGGVAVVNGTINASLQGNLVASGKTSNTGVYDFSAPISGLQDGDYLLRVQFPGLGTAEAAEWNATISIANSSAKATPTAAASGQASAITVSGPSEAMNGELIELKGVISSASGAALAGAGISIYDASGEVKDSYIISGADGSFTTYYLVPENQADGQITVTAEFAGSAGYAGSKATHSLTVHRTEVLNPSASPSASPSATSTISSTQQATSPSMKPGPSAASASPPADAINPLPWVLLALAALCGVMIVVVTGMILRSKNKASKRSTDSSLVLLTGDDEEEPVTTSEIADAPLADEPATVLISQPAAPPVTVATQPTAPQHTESLAADQPTAVFERVQPHRAAQPHWDETATNSKPARAELSDPDQGPATTEWSDWGQEPPVAPRRGL